MGTHQGVLMQSESKSDHAVEKDTGSPVNDAWISPTGSKFPLLTPEQLRKLRRTAVYFALCVFIVLGLDYYLRHDSLGYLVARRGFRDFKRQNLRGIGAVYLADAVAGCNFDGADLGDANLVGVDFVRCSFRETGFQGARLHGVTFRRCNLAGANFRAVKGSCRFGDSKLTGAVFEASTLYGCSLQNQILPHTNFRVAKLRNCIFKDTDLRYCDFEGADLSGANLDGANLTGANLRGANLTGCSSTGSVVESVTMDEKTIWPTTNIHSKN